MSHRHPIDDLFRRRLGNHQEPPPMQVWDRIEQKRRRDAAGVPSAFGKFAAAASIGLLLFFLQTDVHQFNQPEDAILANASERTPPTYPALTDTAPDFQNSSSSLINNSPDLTTQDQTAGASARFISHTEDTPANMAVAEQSLVEAPSAKEWSAPANWEEAPQLPAMATAFLRQRTYPSPSQCASFRSSGWKMFAEWTAGIEGSFRSLYPSQGTPENEAYANFRNQAEVTLPGYSAQLRLAAVSRSGMVLRTGIHFAQIREQLRHIKETEERFTVINVLGPTGEVVGIDTVYETIFREDRLPVRYQTLSVPVLAGFEKRFGRWSAGLLAGALVNVKFNQRGHVVLPNADMPVSIATAEEEVDNLFQPHLGIGWYAAANISWKIHDKMQITAEPYLRAFPKSMTPESFPVQQKYMHSGIALGLRYAI